MEGLWAYSGKGVWGGGLKETNTTLLNFQRSRSRCKRWKSMANVFSHSNCFGQIRSWYWIFIWRFSQCIDRDTFQLLIKFCHVLFYWDRNSVIIVFFKVLSRIDIGTYQCINKHVPGIDISVVESSSFFSPYQFHVG